jgi:hypothetical protein
MAASGVSANAVVTSVLDDQGTAEEGVPRAYTAGARLAYEITANPSNV